MPHTGDYGFGSLASVPVPPTLVSGEPRPVTDRVKPGLGMPKIRPVRRPRPNPIGQPVVGPISATRPVRQSATVGNGQVVDPFRAALERRAKKGLSSNNPTDLRAKAQALRATAL